MESLTPDALNGGASASQGFIADLVGQRSSTELIVLATVLASAFLLPLLNKLLTPTLDPREPPAIKPSIPWIGHIIGIIKHQSDYHRIIHNAHPSRSAITLPMLNGKLYAIYDPQLVQSVLRNKIASFEPFVEDFAQKTFGLEEPTFRKIKDTPGLIEDFTDAIHASFQTESLHKMNVHFLGSISEKMNPVSQGSMILDKKNAGKERLLDGGFEVEHLFLWVRDVMSMATMKSLYGDHNPFDGDYDLIDDIWTFEAAVPYFLLNLPTMAMRKSYDARANIQALLRKYYVAEYDFQDPSASTLVLNRAAALRRHKFNGEEMGSTEAILPVVATINAVPTFYWMMLFIYDRPELVARLQKEVEGAATITDENGAKTVTFNIAEFDDKLPLLISCYRETMRLCNHSVSVRRIMTDLTVTDSRGQTFLLKQGTDLQLPAGVTHYDETIWGSDASSFNAERFLPPVVRDRSPEGLETEKRRKAGYFPFGGGRHLCPGRNFAFAEILGFMAVLLLGFDIEATGKQFGEVKMLGPQLASGTVKPEKGGKGLGAKIHVREGYEDVDWKFKC